VIPCYRVRRHVLDVVDGIAGLVDAIYVIDDACPEGTGRLVQARRPGVTVLFHAANQGVGGAVMTGYARALADGYQVVVKMDGDGQMDPAYLAALTGPVLRGEVGYAKGNRFAAWPRAMPPARILGNLVASAVMRLVSDWRGMDPCNGYTAIHADLLGCLPFDRLERRWFFESDMLCWLASIGQVVRDVPIPARYGDERSGLNAALAIREFFPRFAARLLRRGW
jgi:glycosyltransferase involved in cell wall biosynthesis